MSFLYVKRPGGAATGGSGVHPTPKTGSWATALPNAADYYDEIDLANADASDGDVICVSTLHSVGDHGNFQSKMKSGAIYTVDDNNVDQVVPSPNAQWNQATSGASVIPSEQNEEALIIEGLHFKTGGTHYTSNAKGFGRFHDHRTESGDTSSNRYVRSALANAGARSLHHNTTVNYPSSGQGLRYTGSESSQLFIGGSFISGTTVCVYHDAQEHNVAFVGSDFSQNQAGTDLLSAPGSASAQTTYFYHWEGCPLPPSYAIANNFGSFSCGVLIENCDRDNQWDYYCRAGQILLDTSVYYNSDELLEDGVNRASLRYLSETGVGSVRPDRCNVLMPMLPYGPKWIERKNTSFATTPKARLKILSANALNEGSIDVYLLYADATTSYHFKTVRHHIPLINTAPAALSTETGQWTGAAGTQYIFDLDMPGGGDGWVRAMVGLNNDGSDLDAYLSPQIDFVA